MKKFISQSFFIRLSHWEYWPFDVVYFPVYIYWLWLSIKAKSFFFFNTCNPTIRNGGFLMESKKEIYDLIPSNLYPLTIFFKSNTSENDVKETVKQKGLKYPLIGKPDIGMKGMGVKKLETEKDLIDYAACSKVDFLVQEFISFKNEVGIFYYRFPNKSKGHISGIVRKEFLTVKGNGISTIEQLLLDNTRFLLQLPVLKKEYPGKLNTILNNGEELLLVPYGNHARGARFIDDSNLIDEELLNSIDTVCKNINGFYFGRMDIRFNSWEELKQGKKFSIIELNGAGSEPTHIYDPDHSIFFAWKEIIRHLNIMWRISQINHHQKERPYMSTKSGLKMLKESRAYIKLIKPV